MKDLKSRMIQKRLDIFDSCKRLNNKIDYYSNRNLFTFKDWITVLEIRTSLLSMYLDYIEMEKRDEKLTNILIQSEGKNKKYEFTRK